MVKITKCKTNYKHENLGMAYRISSILQNFPSEVLLGAAIITNPKVTPLQKKSQKEAEETVMGFDRLWGCF